MKLTIGVGETIVGITLLGEAEGAEPLLRDHFKDYLCPERCSDGELTISVLSYPDRTPPLLTLGPKRVIEQRLSTPDVATWLGNIPGQTHDFPITTGIIASSFLNGLLLFNPESSNGCLLLKEGKGRHWPLYRLCWMYLAQVLGERKGCFLHSAALVRNGKGYLFIGRSGAGKTTLARRFGGSMVFSDDSPVLRERDGDFWVSPSPYRQTDSLQKTGGDLTGLKAPVEGLYFIRQDGRTYLEGIAKREALAQIMNRHILFIPYLSARARADLFHLFFDACDRIPPHNLHVCLDQGIWGAIDAAEGRLK